MSQLILGIMVIFAILGGIDRIWGNKYGLGKAFEEGFYAMGSLALAMIGVICLAPVLANVLGPMITPFFTILGADPAMFAGCILANDMGGAVLAEQLAIDHEAALFSGLIIGAMLGTTTVFTIPVALGIIDKSDQPYLATGILAGLTTIPIGGFAGGMVAGYAPQMLIKNLIPIMLLSGVLILLFLKFPQKTIRWFGYFGQGVVIVITCGLVAAIVEALTGIVVIPGMAPLSEGFIIVGNIAIVLAGAFPLVYMIRKVCQKWLSQLGRLLSINAVAAAGLVATLASVLPMFAMMKDMDKNGKVINVAFAVSAAFVFGDHLGFTAGYAPEMIFPVIVSQLVGGITSIGVAQYVLKKIPLDD